MLRSFRSLVSKKIAVFVSAAVLALAALFCACVWETAHSALQVAEKNAKTADIVPSSLITLAPSSTSFERLLTPSGFRNAAEFQGSLYVSSSSALFEYSEGELKHTWYVGRELPPFPLLSLAVRMGSATPELWIATDGGGIVIYNGSIMRQLLPRLPAARTVSALLMLHNGRVLVGSRQGLYISDGDSLTSFHRNFEKTDVTSLSGDEDDFWIGTRADGAWHWLGGEAVHITAELPDPQVLSIAVRAAQAWIGTPVGVSEFTGGKLSRHLAEGIFARALAERDGTLWIGTIDQGTFELRLDSRPLRPQSLSADQPAISNAFAETTNALLSVQAHGIAELPSGRMLIEAPTPSLAGEHITALHEDSRGRLWIGYFDHGLDIVDLSMGGELTHLEDDVLFCVNRIKESPGDATVVAATANGLAVFDRKARVRQVLDRETGLIASNVTDVLFRRGDEGAALMVVATPAGLSFFDHGSFSSIYAFQGLTNNHVYTLAENNGTVYVGTLGGLSAVKNGLVQASFTTANSTLRQNWITASAEFEGALYLGTYGSGVVRLEQSGAFTSYLSFSGRRCEINLNAMLTTNRALYAGTAGEGIAILPAGSDRWQFLRDGLPSHNVTALDARDGRIYIGTDNGVVRILENNLLP